MRSKYYERFQKYSSENLFKVILNPNDFQPEAVEEALKIVEDRNLSSVLKIKIEEHQKLKSIEEEIQFEEIEAKAAYYNDVLDYQTNGFSFQVRIADFAKLEGILNEREIQFYREDKNIGVQLDSYPTQTYYFKNEDKLIVDELIKEIGLLTLPYADIRPFFFFTTITIITITILSVLVLYVLKNL